MRRALAVLVLLAPLAGCGGEEDSVLEAGDAYVVVGSDPDQGDGAEITGVVELVGDCLGIAGRVAYWPSGTTVVSADPLTIDVPGEGRVTIGDTVRGGGGIGAAPDGVDMPDGCPGEVVTYRAV